MTDDLPEGNDRPPEGRGGPRKLDTSTRVNVAFPFSQIRVQEPSTDLGELASVVEGLATLVRVQAPGEEADELLRRAAAVAARLRRG